jgi:hypothetical protein
MSQSDDIEKDHFAFFWATFFKHHLAFLGTSVDTLVSNAVADTYKIFLLSLVIANKR